MIIFQQATWGDSPKEAPAKEQEKAQKQQLKSVFEELQTKIAFSRTMCKKEGLSTDNLRISKLQEEISGRLETDGLLPHDNGWQAPLPKELEYEWVLHLFGADARGPLFEYEYKVAIYLAILDYYNTNLPSFLEGVKHSSIMQEFIDRQPSRAERTPGSDFV